MTSLNEALHGGPDQGVFVNVNVPLGIIDVTATPVVEELLGPSGGVGRRISPILCPELEHEWLLKGGAGTAGRMEKWEDTTTGFRCHFNADLLAYHDDPDDTFSPGNTIRPIHGEWNRSVAQGPNDTDPATNPRINNFAWDFEERFYAALAEHNGWSDKAEYFSDSVKKNTSGAAGARRYLQNPVLNWYMRDFNFGAGQTAAEAYEKSMLWNQDHMRKRMLSHIAEPVSGQYEPFDASVGDRVVNENTPREWTGGRQWNVPGDDDFNGFNTWDRGHNESMPQFTAAVMGHPIGFVNMWMGWRWIIQAYPPGSSTSSPHHMDQPRSAAWYILWIVRAWLCGFNDADDEIVIEQVGGFYGANGGNGWRPQDVLENALSRALTARWDGGAGALNGPQIDVDKKCSDSGVMACLCNGNQDDFIGSDGNSYGPQVIGEYVWQSGMLLYAFIYAKEFYDYLFTNFGQQPFSATVYQGLQDKIRDMIQFLEDFGMYYDGTDGSSNAVNDPPQPAFQKGSIANSLHNNFYDDTANEPNPRGYPATSPNEPDLGIPQEMRDSLYTCSTTKGDKHFVYKLPNHPGRAVLRQQPGGSPTSEHFIVPQMAWQRGTADAIVSSVVHDGPADERWYIPTTSDYKDNWQRYTLFYYRLEENNNGEAVALGEIDATATVEDVSQAFSSATIALGAIDAASVLEDIDFQIDNNGVEIPLGVINSFAIPFRPGVFVQGDAFVELGLINSFAIPFRPFVLIEDGDVEVVLDEITATTTVEDVDLSIINNNIEVGLGQIFATATTGDVSVSHELVLVELGAADAASSAESPSFEIGETTVDATAVVVSPTLSYGSATISLGFITSTADMSADFSGGPEVVVTVEEQRGREINLPLDAKTGQPIEVFSHQDEDLDSVSNSDDVTFSKQLVPGNAYEVSCVAQSINDNGKVFLLPSDVSPENGYNWLWGRNPVFRFTARPEHQQVRVTSSAARDWTLRELR